MVFFCRVISTSSSTHICWRKINQWGMAFLFQIPIDLTSLTHIGGAYWTFTREMQFLFRSFGILELKNFIISEDSKIINKIVFGYERFKMFDDKATVVETNFSCTSFKNLSDKEWSKLSETAQDLFSFFNQFFMLHKVKITIRFYLAEGPIQKVTTAVSSNFIFVTTYLVQTIIAWASIEK